MGEIYDNRERARSLRRRLNDHGVDLATLAEETAAVFDAAGMRAHVRWLELEQRGYTSSTEARSLHEALGIAAGDRLVVQVKGYRVQVGQLAKGASFHHFFVESIAELVAAQARVRSSGRSGEVRLDFAGSSARPHVPTAGTFRVDVFDRILLGLRSVLHLQLAPVAQ